MPVQIQSHAIELVMQNTTERIEISLTDSDCKPIDPSSLKLTIMNQGVVRSIDMWKPTQDPIPARIRRAGKGIYYFPFGADNANGYPATLRSSNPPAGPFDISVNNLFKLSMDGKPAITVTLTAAVPTSMTPTEWVTQMNAAMVANWGEAYANSARYYGGEFFLTSPQVITLENSKIQVDTSIANSAHAVFFGPAPISPLIQGPMHADICIQSLLSNRTQSNGDYMFHWQCEAYKGAESISLLQVVKVASAKSYAILPYLRLELDKAIKEVGRDKARTGYTDAQLMAYLTLAVSEINSYQPITSMTLDTFPVAQFQMMLIWTATLIGLVSQGLYAVDTDIEYSDRGASFRMDHSGKIQSYVNMVSSRLQQQMQGFKLQFASVGTVKFEAGANYRLQQLLQAAPEGALFRGIFSK
jgi:hypothetical protein